MINLLCFFVFAHSPCPFISNWCYIKCVGFLLLVNFRISRCFVQMVALWSEHDACEMHVYWQNQTNQNSRQPSGYFSLHAQTRSFSPFNNPTPFLNCLISVLKGVPLRIIRITLPSATLSLWCPVICKKFYSYVCLLPRSRSWRNECTRSVMISHQSWLVKLAEL